MSDFNVLCSCDGFDWDGNLSCTWIITENRDIFAIEDSFVNFVGKMDHIFWKFHFCNSLKQSIDLSFCGTSLNVIMFPWFPIDQRITKESAGSRSAFSCLFTESKITVSEGEQFWVSCSFEHWWICHRFSLLRAQKKDGILSSLEVVDYSSSQCPVSSSWIWKKLGKADTEYAISGLVQVASCVKLPMSWRYKWGSNVQVASCIQHRWKADLHL